MAKTRQFEISIENRPGAVAEIARTLGNAKVNILALLGAARGTGGSVQVIVEDARRARKALDEAKLSYRETTAEEYELANKPGALAQYLDKLAARGVNLNTICATSSKGAKKAILVYTAEAAVKNEASAA
ncbi:MAG TPA: ACT domain-containing protein [Terriglobales bacterium]|jgi:hypothetical protein